MKRLKNEKTEKSRANVKGREENWEKGKREKNKTRKKGKREKQKEEN